MPKNNSNRDDAEFLAACLKGKLNSPWSKNPMCSSKRAFEIQKTKNWKKAADTIPTKDEAKKRRCSVQKINIMNGKNKP